MNPCRASAKFAESAMGAVSRSVTHTRLSVRVLAAPEEDSWFGAVNQMQLAETGVATAGAIAIAPSKNLADHLRVSAARLQLYCCSGLLVVWMWQLQHQWRY
eukprot:GHUV01024496.1.p1 GENE.GHUV01024496.1~~GHUV01024496.1.p1  ORF type:complete len:102 (+),score=17.22 GHUV01024496.1:1111-1416(+)